MLTISSSPYRLNSRPTPLCLTPPKGILGSDFTAPLMKTSPDSISRARSSARERSWVHRLAPRPNSESFAARIADAKSRTASTGATGPNVSSRRTRISFVTPAKRVGSKYHPERRMRLPPTTTRAPFDTASRTCVSISSRWPSLTNGPMSVEGSRGSPILSPRMRSANFSMNSSTTESTTKNRFAAMQD